jgi:hypothetical protein
MTDAHAAARTRPRTSTEEAGIALSALDCVLNGDKAAYASSDLTTGRRFYELLRESGARDAEGLRAQLGAEAYHRRLFEPNAEAANAFARRLGDLLGGRALVITPAPLSVPDWSQAEYLGFFATLIRTRVHAVYFNEGWEYSNGCTFEFVTAQEAGVPTFDARGAPLDRAAALRLIGGAVKELQAGHIEPIGLLRHHARLLRLDEPSPTPDAKAD